MAAMPPSAESLVLMGRVIRSHGIQGALKVYPLTDDPHRFADLEQVYMGTDAAHTTPYTVRSARVQTTTKGPQVILELEGLTSRDAADALRQYDLFAPEADLPLDEDEVFLHDLLGLDVIDAQGQPIGVLKAVMPNPAHDIYVIARDGRPDALVPAVPEFVDAIDLDAGQIHIRPIDGLID